jgi:RimJ/RimL family protein N-acetyltransferase
MALLPDQILTERLVLKKSSMSYLDTWLQAIDDSRPELLPWMAWAAEAVSKAERIAELQKYITSFEQDKNLYHYFIFELHSSKFVGCINLKKLEATDYWTIGYWLTTAMTGHGYVTEAALALEKVAQEKLGVTSIRIKIKSQNVKSRRVAERLGFSLTKDTEGEFIFYEKK